MLPFLDKKSKAGSVAGLILQRKGKQDVAVSPEVESGESIDPAIKECAEDVMRAVEQKSVIDLAHALHAFFEICDAMPDEAEGDQE